jgi:molybdopterin converting factor subunit 1
MAVTVRFFGWSADLAGARDAVVEFDTARTVAQIRSTLLERYPRLIELGSTARIAVNLKYAGEDAPVRDGDEVAIIPPVSGG